MRLSANAKKNYSKLICHSTSRRSRLYDNCKLLKLQLYNFKMKSNYQNLSNYAQKMIE